MLRVLVVSHTYIASINREKWKILSQQYKDIVLTVVFPDTWPTTLFNHIADIKDEEQSERCLFMALPCLRAGNEVMYRYYWQKIAQIIKNVKPDLLHIEQGDSALSYLQMNIVGKFYNRAMKSVFFTWVNWEQKFSYKHQLIIGSMARLNRFYADGAFVGNNDAKNILQNKGFNKPISVVPQLGVSITMSSDMYVEQSVKNRKIKKIAFIGRLVEEKGILFLIDAFSALMHDFPDWNLLIVGTGPLMNSINTVIIQKKLSERVQIAPPCSHYEVRTILEQTTILVLPSIDMPHWREQLGHILLEAMACRVAVIGTDAGEIPHVLADAGIVVKQKNTQALLEALKKLMQDDHARIILGNAGYKRVCENYTHQAIAKKTYEFWRLICDN